MRLPFTQVASEVIEHGAADLAVMLDWDEAHAGWGLLRLFDWALKRAKDDRPPSQSDTISGPGAARLVARAAGWSGDPEAFVTACEHLPEAPVERMENGAVRVCGLRRYDSAWGKGQPKEVWAAWRAYMAGEGPYPLVIPIRAGSKPEPERVGGGSGADPERIRSGSGPEPERNRAEPVADPARKTQTQTQTHMQSLPSEDVRTAAAVPEKPDKPDDLWGGAELVAWMQAKRFEEGFPRDKRASEGAVSTWLSSRLMEGFTLRDIRLGFCAFGGDPYWLERALPIAGFISQWEKYTRKQVVAHAS